MTVIQTILGGKAGADPETVMDLALETVRDHLDMDLCFICEFMGDSVHFRRIADPGHTGLINPSQTQQLSELYCGHILAGRLPQMMPDVQAIPLARDLQITSELGIGAFISVPLHRKDGSIYGSFCCLSRRSNTSLNDRDLNFVKMFADVTSTSLNTQLENHEKQEKMTHMITDVMAGRDFEIYWQPIVDLATTRSIGVEALSRFAPLPYRPPNLWFADAAEVGLQLELEQATLAAALADSSALPPNLYLSLNASPPMIASGWLPKLFRTADPKRIVLEITEHEAIADHDGVISALSDLREMGVRLAVDDVGAGYAGLSTVLRLQPDILKLDRSLVSQIDEDPARQSLANAMVHFAGEVGAKVIAEGIERSQEHQMLHRLGVTMGQGYLFARPGPASNLQLAAAG